MTKTITRTYCDYCGKEIQQNEIMQGLSIKLTSSSDAIWREYRGRNEFDYCPECAVKIIRIIAGEFHPTLDVAEQVKGVTVSPDLESYGTCPNCGEKVISGYCNIGKEDRCTYCGQKLKW